jgi:hypothetical protein
VPHGVRLACYARHDRTIPGWGRRCVWTATTTTAQVVWNLMAGELWRRTTIAINRHIRRLRPSAASPTCRRVTGTGRVRWVCPVRLSFGKAAEMQHRARRALPRHHPPRRLRPRHPDAILPPPPQLDAADSGRRVDHAATTVGSPPSRIRPGPAVADRLG